MREGKVLLQLAVCFMSRVAFLTLVSLVKFPAAHLNPYILLHYVLCASLQDQVEQLMDEHMEAALQRIFRD